ncbi:MAG: U32 family peptidase [Bacilli bacterium]|nr:U32 family peptidase [Bacilli bacterium]MDD4547206.1 U32 family peptidase [Bacilli bacterium]
MTKIMVIPKNRKMIDNLINKSDAFLIGIENLSVNLPAYYKLNEVEEIVTFLKNNNKQIFVSLNMNIRNENLELLESTMQKLNDMDIDGILYYDMAVLNLWKKHQFKYDLVWAQEHFATNYDTCNYYNSLGIKYGLLSTEITLDEVKDIVKNTNMLLILPVFGYLPMFTSFRHLVNNYLDYFDHQKSGNNYYMEKEGKKYPLIDDNNGTFVYSGNIINGLAETIQLKEVGLDYILLNSFLIDDQKFEKIVEMFNTLDKDNVDELDNEIFDMFGNVDKGFLYKETVYKVKKND